MNVEQKLEAILFYKNEPVEIKKLAGILGVEEKEAKEELKKLQDSLQTQNRGICLILTDKEASLATAPEMSALIEQMTKDEMSRGIGKSGLETLAIILYNQTGISRKRIDYVRGVNSTFILRNLLTRGLIEREVSPSDARTFVYKPTIGLLAHIGITRFNDLPEFAEFNKELQKVEEVKEE